MSATCPPKPEKNRLITTMSRLDRAPKVDVDVAVNSSDWAKDVVAQEFSALDKLYGYLSFLDVSFLSTDALVACGDADAHAKCIATVGKDTSLFGQEFDATPICQRMQLFCFANYVAPSAVPDFMECTVRLSLSSVYSFFVESCSGSTCSF